MRLDGKLSGTRSSDKTIYIGNFFKLQLAGQT